MGKMIIAENSNGLVCQFTEEQWGNLVRSGHTRKWKVLDETDEEVIKQPVVIKEIETVDSVESFGDIETYYDLSYTLRDYSHLLDEAGIKYNKRIKDPEKLKAIWEKAQNPKPAVDDKTNVEK